jgi:hypothetical protein
LDADISTCQREDLIMDVLQGRLMVAASVCLFVDRPVSFAVTINHPAPRAYPNGANGLQGPVAVQIWQCARLNVPSECGVALDRVAPGIETRLQGFALLVLEGCWT